MKNEKLKVNVENDEIHRARVHVGFNVGFLSVNTHAYIRVRFITIRISVHEEFEN